MTKVFRLPWFISSWVDGDTCHGTMDMGWRHMWSPKPGLRLLVADGSAYDAPERKGLSLPRANRARDRAAELAPPGQWYMALSHYLDPDDFARPLCSIELPDGRDLASVLIEEGHVK